MADDKKVVSNPFSLSKDDVNNCINALAIYGGSIQRRINSENNSEIKKLLEKEMDSLEETRKILRR